MKLLYSKNIKLFSFFTELIPIGSFFIIYSLYNIFIAAFITLLISSSLFLYHLKKEKRKNYFSIFSILITFFLTFFAFVFDDPMFIKIQPTLFNGFFSFILLFGLYFQRPVMKDFFEYQFNLNLNTWFMLSKRWGLFFLLLSLTNEIVWRNFTETQWVFFKTFLISPLVIIFMIFQIPITLKGTNKSEKKYKN